MGISSGPPIAAGLQMAEEGEPKVEQAWQPTWRSTRKEWELWKENADLRRQLADAKAENERLRKLVKRYYKKHHEAVMADAVRVAGGFTDCLCTICADVRGLEATEEDH